MVTRGYYSEEEPTTFRRCGPRGQSYPLAQERFEHPHPSRSYSNGRNGDHASENNDQGHPTRRRTQLACQRCRKRKIRCSGEDGGRPCYHCKQSSSEPCEFFRVAAMPLEQAKDLPTNCFDENSRSMYRHVPSNAHFNYFQPPQTVSLEPNSINYRQLNYSNYGYTGTKFLGLTYDNLTEEPVEFNLSHPNAFQVAAQDSVSSYPAQNNGRARTNPPAPMYLDAEASANYNMTAYQSYSSGNARSMIDSESKNFCVTNPTALPPYGAVNGTTVPQAALNVASGVERPVLPHPSVDRQFRSTNDGTACPMSSLQAYGFLNSTMTGPGKINGTSIQMPSSNSYMSGVPISSPQEVSTAAAEMAYNSSHRIQQDTEMYDTSNLNSNLYYPQTNDSTADMSHYGTSSGSEPPKSRQASHSENSWAPSNRKSSSSGSLSNGQPYVPDTKDHYPQPVMPSQNLLQHPHIPQIQHDGLPHPRSEYVSSISSR